jgi:hypothetical protein
LIAKTTIAALQERIPESASLLTFRYFSDGVQSYRRFLGEHGFTLIDVHSDSGNNTCYLPKKAGPPR